MNVYLYLTEIFNAGKVRAIITSGQAVVLHKLAIMSKDGDWIIREDAESFTHIIKVLSSLNAKYRFGAPFDLKWLKHGWSAHFELYLDKKRVRTDFFSRPPRININDLKQFWKQKSSPVFVNEVQLSETKKTMRLKDYAVIGELARKMKKPENQILYSRSARDLILLGEQHNKLFMQIVKKRPALASAKNGLDELERALFEEQRLLMKEDEKRLLSYSIAAEEWRNHWQKMEKELEGLSLEETHAIIVKAAEEFLPKRVS